MRAIAGIGLRRAAVRFGFATPAGEIDREFTTPWCWRWAAAAGRASASGRCLAAAAGRQGVAVAPLRWANCGLTCPGARTSGSACRSAGQAGGVVADRPARCLHRRQGEFVVTEDGVEGSLIYAPSALLRDAISRRRLGYGVAGPARGAIIDECFAELSQPRGLAFDLQSHLQSKVAIAGVKAGLLRECLPVEDFQQPARLAAAIKALPLRLVASRPIDEAIPVPRWGAFSRGWMAGR